MLFDEVIDHIIFRNKTDLPFHILTWKKIMDYLSEYKPEKISPEEERLLSNSITGEWDIKLPYDDDLEIWTNKGLKEGFRKNEVYRQIGKFRSKPCAMGNYSWITGADIFLCEHSIDEETGIGMITISYNMDAPFFKNQVENAEK